MELESIFGQKMKVNKAAYGWSQSTIGARDMVDGPRRILLWAP